MFEKITKTLSGLAFIKYINSLIDYVNTSDIDATRIKGQLDISNIPPAGLDNVIKVDTVTDMLALTVDDVQNGDTVMIIGVTPPVQYQVVDDTKLGTMDAFQEYAAGTATKALADINGNNIHTTYGKLAGNNTWTGNNYWNGSAIFNANLNIRGSATTPSDTSIYLWLGLKPEGSKQSPCIARNKTGELMIYAADYRHCFLKSGIQTSFASVCNSDGTVEFSSLNNTPWGKYTNANGLELTVNKTPTVNTDVSNKKYVDDSVASATADLLSSNNMWTGTNTYNRDIYITNGSSAGSSGTLYLGVKPTNETVQARIGTDKLGGLFYHASTNQPHVFRVGTNNNVFVIRDDNTKVAFSSNNNPFATVTHDGVAKWLGNAKTATKLETARTINGVAFDGTKDITIEAVGALTAAQTAQQTANTALNIANNALSVGTAAATAATAAQNRADEAYDLADAAQKAADAAQNTADAAQEAANNAANDATNALIKAEDALTKIEPLSVLNYYNNLTEATDVNTLVDIHRWYLQASNNPNAPETNPGFLNVDNDYNDSVCKQLWVSETTGAIYNRFGQIVENSDPATVSSWSEWYKLATKADIDGTTTDLTEKITTVANNLATHEADFSNPHKVTAEQLGLTTVYQYKGSVATYADLPTTGQKVGDVWNVETADPDHGIKAGDNVAWDGAQWDILGGNHDLSGYAQLNLANIFTALNIFRGNIAVSNGTAAGSQGQVIFGVKPSTATVQANIIASTTGALNYIATESTGHFFKIGNNTASTSITTNDSETAILSHNAFEFARITNVGVAKWLGNANTATKLETARTINGVAFDGTKDITINCDAGSGSNLTTYTSLEQIGITPGEETFASIHSALPINSVLEYYASEAQNFADIYPASYGNFIATRLTGDITIFHFTGTNQTMYVTHYHVTNNTNPSWTQIAKQSDLTNLSNSVVKSVNGIKPTNGNVTIDIPKPVIASEAEAEAGTNNTKFMSPLRVKQAISALAGDSSWTISKGTNGWARENSTGLTVQWGYVNRSNIGGTFTFPRTFTTCYYSNVMCSSNLKPYITARSNTSITFNTNNGYNDDIQNWGNCYIFAIGVS